MRLFFASFLLALTFQSGQNGPMTSKSRRQFIALGLTSVVYTGLGAPSDQDAAVIAAFLGALLRSPDFVWVDRLKDDSVILLDVRSPEKTGMLQDQMITDAGDHELVAELVRAIRERNMKPGSKFDGIETSFAGLSVKPPVFIGDIAAHSGESEWETLNRIHPKAVAWASPWLPGYSEEGNLALARCWWGPWPHGATASAELKKTDAGWSVTWIKLTVYA